MAEYGKNKTQPMKKKIKNNEQDSTIVKKGVVSNEKTSSDKEKIPTKSNSEKSN